MYRNWTITRWETPVADISRLLMVSLVDANRELTILFETGRNTGSRRWRVRFGHCQAYRNIDEAYRMDLWRWLTESGQRCGYTFTVCEPVPLDSWGTGYLHHMYPEVQHYVIATDDDVVEVLATEMPIWEPAETPLPGDTRPGKSTHLYFGEDDAAIERLSADIESRNRAKETD